MIGFSYSFHYVGLWLRISETDEITDDDDECDWEN